MASSLRTYLEEIKKKARLSTGEETREIKFIGTY
jgi:hypothetical protein